MRGRVVLLLVLVIVVVAVAVGALMLSPGDDPAADTTGTPGTPDPGQAAVTTQPGDTPAPVVTQDFLTTPVVIALQDLPRGLELTSDLISGPSPAVGIDYWPV